MMQWQAKQATSKLLPTCIRCCCCCRCNWTNCCCCCCHVGIEQRVADLTLMPVDYGLGLRIVNIKRDEPFHPHWVSFACFLANDALFLSRHHTPGDQYGISIAATSQHLSLALCTALPSKSIYTTSASHTYQKRLQDLEEAGSANGGQHYATVVMYLTDVQEGGETVGHTAWCHNDCTFLVVMHLPH